MSEQSADPQYQIRVHPRARHVRLRLDPRDGLVVTVPVRFDRRRLPAMLAERADWIRRVRQRQAAIRAGLAADLRGWRPRRVELTSLGRSWGVAYQTVPGVRLRFRQEPQWLILGLPDMDSRQLDDRVAERLRRWLLSRARCYLFDRVAELADLTGLRYRKIQVRNQRSRWGSCSTRGDLSLNARLLFCPPEACSYVLLHELVHTVHPDHSAAFWSRVAELVPDYRRQQDQLRNVWLRLPDWV